MEAKLKSDHSADADWEPDRREMRKEQLPNELINIISLPLGIWDAKRPPRGPRQGHASRAGPSSQSAPLGDPRGVARMAHNQQWLPKLSWNCSCVDTTAALVGTC